MGTKRLALFLYEVGYIINGKISFPNVNTIDKINDFIAECYIKNKELLSIIYSDLSMLERCIENNIPFISLELVIFLYQEYYGDEKYIQLVEQVGYKTDQKINELALKCVEYCNKTMKRTKRLPSVYESIIQ